MSVQTLQKFSLLSVAKDIVLSYNNSSVQDFHRCKYVVGPFDGLNSELIQELLNILCEKKQLKVCHLHILLHSNIKHLDLSVCSSVVSDQILGVVGYRCKKLTQLSLKNCSRLSTKALRQIPKSLPCIRSINVSGCLACTDDVLESFGSCCTELKVLWAESCSQITDAGIHLLCGDDCAPRCRRLRDVNLASSSITSYGMQKILLTQTELQKFHLAMTQCSDAFGLNVGGLSKNLRLVSLNLSYTSVTDLSVKSLCEACPLLCDFYLNCCSCVTEGCLQFIASLKHLRLFSIAGNAAIKFQPHLVKFLEKSGNLLESLNISGLERVNTKVLGTLCRSLKCLVMSDCKDLVGNFILSPAGEENNLSLARACPKLNQLNLHGCKFAQSKSLLEHLSSILSNSVELQVLDLSTFEELTDEILLQLMKSSSFSHLRSLNLSRCHELSVEPMFLLSETCSNLVQLDISHCQNISLQDVEDMKRVNRDLGVRLNVTWV